MATVEAGPPAAVALTVKRAAQEADRPAAQSLCVGRASVTSALVGTRP